MPSKITINGLFNDIWCYLFTACFDWKIGLYQQTVVRVYYILKYKQKITGKTGNNETKGIQTMVPLKYLSNFWRTLEMPSINCEINIFLTWSEKRIIVTKNYSNQETKFAITDQKLFVPVSCDFISSKLPNWSKFSGSK